MVVGRIMSRVTVSTEGLPQLGKQDTTSPSHGGVAPHHLAAGSGVRIRPQCQVAKAPGTGAHRSTARHVCHNKPIRRSLG